MNVKVSFIIPTYNAEKTVRGTITSILALPVSLEIIVADDGSEDRTREIVSEIGDERIRVLACPHGGVSAARNAGLAAARGKYVHFTDADDLVLGDGFCDALSCAEDGVEAVMFAFRRSDREEPEKTPLAPGFYEEHKTFDDLKWRLLDVRFAARYKAGYIEGKIFQYLFLKEFLLGEGLHFPEGLPFAEDCVFLYDCFRRCPRMRVTDACGYCYVVLPESASRKYRPHHWEEYKDVMARLTGIEGHVPENAARFLYQNGNYVMWKAVLYFGREDVRAADELIRHVISDPVYRDALAHVDFDDFSRGERLQNLMARLGLAGLYGRWLRRKCGI